MAKEEIVKVFYESKYNNFGMIHYKDAAEISLKVINKYIIEELEKHIEHPNKPGYKRSDIVDRIKELKS